MGLKGLNDWSRRPLRLANQLPTTIERLIVQAKKRYPSWGRPRFAKLRPQCAPVRCPAVSTVHAVWIAAAWSAAVGVAASDRTRHSR